MYEVEPICAHGHRVCCCGAASARIYGIEGQIRYNVDANLNLNVGATWTHARYRSFPNAPFYGYCDPAVIFSPTARTFCASGKGSIVETTVGAGGDHMPRSPHYTAHVSP